MERTITIKGVGKMKVNPDLVILNIIVDSKEKKYSDAVEKAAQKIEKLDNALVLVGIKKDEVKTSNYTVRTNYVFINDKKNQSKRQFDGYTCEHKLKVSFDYDMKTLANVLESISNCFSEPQFDIVFTVKDKDAVNEELLSIAVKNAKKKAEILCEASGAKLGKLATINYNWSDINIFSRPPIRFDDTAELSIPKLNATTSINIQPDSIDVSDSATFVWEIEQ